MSRNSISVMYMAWIVSLIFCGLCLAADVKKHIPALNSYDPGLCNNITHGQEVLVTDKSDKEIILICVKDKGVYHWRPTYGSKNTVGEFFDPGSDCSDILNKREDAGDGFYWITLKDSQPQKVWCDMTSDGGGFMLIGRINSSRTWNVPSHSATVEPYGESHWSSSLGDTPILDFRIQMAIKEDFKATKSHWSYRLKSRRPLRNLMIITAGCDHRSAGIGNIAYVKDLMTERIVTTNLRCSKFGFAWPVLSKFGWNKMNSCLQKPCPWGFAYLDIVRQQVDYNGGFSFSTTRSISGMEYNATAFFGCDNNHCCGCYGPVGGTKDYCTENCKAINGGIVTKNVFTWFWIRSSLPKRLWKKCMDYQVKRDDGKLISYKLLGYSAIPVEGSCKKDSTLLHDGIVVVPDSSRAEKVPAVDGLLEYRKDKQQLYVRSNKTWNVLAKEEKVLQEVDKKHKLNLDKITKLEQNFYNEKKIILQEMDKKHNYSLNKITQFEQNVNQKINQLENVIKKLYDLSVSQVLSRYKECFRYIWLTERNRNKRYSSTSNYKCDNGLSGWYRFGGGAGTRLPTTCVPYKSCGTSYPGWMNGVHPTVADGKVTRTVCFRSSSKCCYASNNIEVVNCGHYYVYKLSPPSGGCADGYCGSDD